MTKVESLATLATWVVMNAIAILIAGNALPQASGAPAAEATIQHSTARA